MNKFLVNQFLPFNLLDPVEVLSYLGLTCVFFLAMRFCTRRVQSNEIDSFLVVNVSMAFTMTLLTGYLNRSQVRLSDFIDIAFLTASFYLTVLLFSVVLNFEALKSGVKALARQSLLEDKLRDPIIVAGFLVLAPVTLFFAAAIQEGGEGASAGIIRGSGGARLIGEGLAPFFIYYSFSTIIVSGRLRNWFMLLPILLAGPLVGSKAALLTPVVNFFMIRGVFKQEMRFREALKLLPLLPLVVVAMIVPLLIFGKSPDAALLQVVSRFFLSGDTYFWLFVAARPEDFYRYYEWSSYLMHPFISVFGQRGYDVPLGAALMGHAMNQLTLGGPNPHAPALALVLFKGSLVWASLFCSGLGALVVSLRYVALRAYWWQSLPPFFRSVAFIVFFQGAPVLLVDLGTTQRIMFSTLVFAVLFFLVGLVVELGQQRRIGRDTGRHELA